MFGNTVFLIAKDNLPGLLSKEEILEGNEIAMYYNALYSLDTLHITRQVNLIINDYKELPETNLYIALKVISDIIKLTKMKFKIYDVSSAIRFGLLK